MATAAPSAVHTAAAPNGPVLSCPHPLGLPGTSNTNELHCRSTLLTENLKHRTTATQGSQYTTEQQELGQPSWGPLQGFRDPHP